MTAGLRMLLGFLSQLLLWQKLFVRLIKKKLAKHGFIPQYQDVQDKYVFKIYLWYLLIALTSSAAFTTIKIKQDPNGNSYFEYF